VTAKEKYQKFKAQVFNAVDEGGKGRLSTVVTSLIMGLVFLNFLMVVIETFDVLTDTWHTFFHAFEVFTVVIFTIEFLVRLWTADLLYPKLGGGKARVKYLFSFMAIVDLVAIIPFYLGALVPINMVMVRSLRVLRMLRILKVTRYSSALTMVGKILKLRSKHLMSSILMIFLMMMIIAVIMYHVENEAQPDAFNNAFDSLWWAIATITTVGFGDVAPITTIGRIMGGLIALLGVGLVAIPTGILTDGFIREMTKEERRERALLRKQKPETVTCPKCGVQCCVEETPPEDTEPITKTTKTDTIS